ncbi:histidine kinase [Actinoplanes friuliensis DSM 7358]|uniref:Sensor-like histidine kinase SenX3 n=1 Tax=Actinoplanes friuliensis DSM 7358 TaxID=1246995 RepID=U5W1D5_9ACTN|nr:histidine kinase [Actinoplanes friuliensis DSM 7358]
MIALGLAGTALAAFALRRTDADRLSRALDQQTAIVAQTLAGEMRRYTTSLLDLAAAVGSQSRLETAEFAAITAATDRQRLPGASGVSLVVPATTGQIGGVERAWRTAGSPGLRLRAAPGIRDGHLFVVQSRPIDGTAEAVGQDLAASTPAATALAKARDSHQVAISPTYRLLEDGDVPSARRQWSFVLAAPVYSTSPAAPDAGQFRGWMVMGLRGADFLHQAISRTAGNTVVLALSDSSAGRRTEVGRWQPAAEPARGQPARTVPIVVPQGTWELTVTPTDRLLPGTDLHLDMIAWAVGGFITLLLAALTGTVITARNRALRRVDAATAALRDDIDRREAVEVQLRQRESELVGFAGIVAHDLRSPLARITGYADFLREEAAPRLEPLHRDFLERLYGGAQRMQSLIDDLLDYATADNQDLVTAQVDLNRMVAEVVRDRVSGHGAQQPRIVVWPLPTVDGDATLLRQVVDNLIGNALKYTPEGEDPSIEITSRREEAGGWRVEVADRGIGIPPDQLDTIFDAFIRAGGSEGYHGTGLGLAIVHRIIERHGGLVGVDSNPGGGSRFWFSLPAHARLVAGTGATERIVHSS